MSIHQFDTLLHHLRPVISKQDNNYHESIGVEERLVITLRYVNKNIDQMKLSLFKNTSKLCYLKHSLLFDIM